MNRQDPDAVRMKEIRVLILSNMNRLYPTALRVSTLFRVMIAFDETYTMSVLEKDLTYLRQKGYVEYIDERIGEFNNHFHRKFVGLTARGKEIADRTAKDDALEI
jgi:hypothetical protein